jgi:hypothetical protein
VRILWGNPLSTAGLRLWVSSENRHESIKKRCLYAKDRWRPGGRQLRQFGDFLAADSGGLW